jgi:AraC-like DNA-binding protein
VDSPLRSLFPLPTRDDDLGAAVVETINLLLPALHRITRLGDTFNEAFLPREQLHRLIAVLLFPELRHRPMQGENASTSGDRRLDRLLDYISLHLADPLPLTVLESVSHYSRRSLHYAFKERFGCSPMQWVRQQRMERALRFLEQAGPTDTVSAAALACGYRSQGRFRIDFERTYGWKPSTVLRQGGLPKGPGDANGVSSSNTTSSVAP